MGGKNYNRYEIAEILVKKILPTTPLHIPGLLGELWTDFNKRDFGVEAWRINKLIPYEGVVILAAPSGEKKSWVAMEMVKSIALGKNFLDYAEFVTTPANVLYIDMEMPKRELWRRGKLLGFNAGGEHIWIIGKDENLNLNQDSSVELLKQFIEERNIKVVFFDTFRALAGGLKEEKADEVRQFFTRFISLKDQGIVLIFLDHCRKPFQFEGKTPKKEQLFGSQDKCGVLENLLMIRSDAQSHEIAVHNVKNRVGWEYPAFKILIEDQVNEEGELVAIKLSHGGNLAAEKVLKLELAKDLIKTALQERPMTTKELVALGRDKKIGQRNITDALKDLEANIDIISEQHGREKRYCLLNNNNTAEGPEMPL
jgi:hypothetical protein